MSYNIVDKTTGDLTKIAGNAKSNSFHGTTADWNLLSLAEKKSYTEAFLTDDYDNPDTDTVKDSIADDFNTSTSYVKGDYVYHLGVLYECTTAHSAGAWDATHFTATQVGDELSELKNTLTNKQNITDNTLTTTSKTVPGAINELKNTLNVLGNPILLAEFGNTTAEQKTIDYTKYRYLLLILSTIATDALTNDASSLTVSRFGRIAVRTYINGNSYYGIIVPTATDKIFNCSVGNSGTVCTVYGIK
jgi:hypothetical protein